jgi:beta-phosphoglucomutase
MMAKAVIFDWDGTLADTRKAVVQSFQRVLTEAGCNVSDEFIERRIGIGTKKTIIEAFRECNLRIDVSKLEKLAQEKISIQTELSNIVNLFTGVTELLEALKGKTKIGLATMSGRKVINRLLSEKKLEAYFEVVVSADDVKNPKPDPEVFLAAAKSLGVDPKDCIVVEDSVFGIRAAKAANMKVIAVATGVYNKQELGIEHPDMLIDSLIDIEKTLSFVFEAD